MRAFTFTCVRQDGAGAHLLPLRGFTGAGVRAGGPGRPRAEHTVLGARRFAHHRDWVDGISTQLPVNFFSWEKKKIKASSSLSFAKLTLNEQLSPDGYTNKLDSVLLYKQGK